MVRKMCLKSEVQILYLSILGPRGDPGPEGQPVCASAFSLVAVIKKSRFRCRANVADLVHPAESMISKFRDLPN